MHNSSVLLVNPHHYHSSSPAVGRGLRSPVDMSGAKFNMRHYSLESPSLTSPPAYDILLPGAVGGAAGLEHGKHLCGGFSAGHLGAICSQNNVMGTPLPISSSPQFNPHLVMAPTAPPGLLHICTFMFLAIALLCFLHATWSELIACLRFSVSDAKLYHLLGCLDG